MDKSTGKILNNLSDKLLKAKRCWLGHTWTRWELFRRQIEGLKNDGKWHIDHPFYQKRQCLGCGYYEEEEIR